MPNPHHSVDTCGYKNGTPQHPNSNLKICNCFKDCVAISRLPIGLEDSSQAVVCTAFLCRNYDCQHITILSKA